MKKDKLSSQVDSSSKEVLRKKTGYPPTPIDWKIVDEYLEAGCFGTEICALFGICEDTLYKRCVKEKGMTFSAYSKQKKAKGDSILRKTQYELALEKDRGMLIWLGKQRLGQSDSPNQDEQNNRLMGVLSDLRALCIDGTPIIEYEKKINDKE